MATGFAALSAATVFAQLSGFVVIVVLARRLSASDIGAYSFALSLMGYFAIPANFGVTVLATRDLAQRPGDARQIMGEVLSLQAFISLLPYAALVALAPVLAVDDHSRAVLPIVGLNFVVEGLLFMWVLYGSGRFALMAFARVAGAATFAAGCLAFVHAGPHAVRTLGWVTLAGVAVTSAITAAVALRDQGRPRLERRPAILLTRFRASVPLGVAAVMISVYYTVDSVMLGYLRSTEVVGQYAIAYKVPLALIGIAALWGAVLFPHASALAEHDRRGLREQLNLFGSVALVGSFPVLAGALLVQGDLMTRLFGPQYAAAATPFVLLMAAAALILFTISYGTVAVAIGDEGHYAIAVTLGALTNVLVNAVAIPLAGMTGAAAATLLAEVVVVAYIMVRLRRALGPLSLEWGRLARALLATAAMTAAVLPLHELTVLARVVVGTGVFTLACVLLRVVAPAELRLVLRSRPTGPIPIAPELPVPDGPVVP